MRKHMMKSGVIWEGDWMLAPLDGGYSMAEIDGPYGMGKASWDRIGIHQLADWYRPHLERVTGLMTPSSTVYLWNTAEGWARIDPVMRGLGWEFRSLIVWNKGTAGCKALWGAAQITEWPDVTEVCAMYQRSDAEAAAISILASEMERERRAAGLSRAAIDAHLGTANVSQYWWQARNWRIPTRTQWEVLQKLAPGRFLASWDDIRKQEQLARSCGVRFSLPVGGTNIWDAPPVRGAERLTDADGQTLHPCQKPILFAERMVQASTRVGDRILVPFGGTCRIAVYLERLTRMFPEEIRYHDTCELNQDGPDYIGSVLRGGDSCTKTRGQVGLFGGGV